MTIIARYRGSRCAACGAPIEVGERIEWRRGQPSRHTHCPSAASSPCPSPRPALAPEEREVNSFSSAPHEVGGVVYLSHCAEGGGPDGHYWLVTGAGSRRCTEAENDCRVGEMIQWAHVRPATAAEAAPVVARRAAEAARVALLDELRALRGVRVHEPMPEGAVVLIPVDRTRMCATGERVALVGGALYHERVGDPDMCDGWYHYVVRLDASAELVARVQDFIAASAE
jgi:hypothetical protein